MTLGRGNFLIALGIFQDRVEGPFLISAPAVKDTYTYHGLAWNIMKLNEPESSISGLAVGAAARNIFWSTPVLRAGFGWWG